MGLNDIDAISKAYTGLTHKPGLFLNKQSFPLTDLPHPFIQNTTTSDTNESTCTSTFHKALMDVMKDHKINNRVIFPGAGFVEFGIAAVLQALI